MLKTNPPGAGVAGDCKAGLGAAGVEAVEDWGMPKEMAGGWAAEKAKGLAAAGAAGAPNSPPPPPPPPPAAAAPPPKMDAGVGFVSIMPMALFMPPLAPVGAPNTGVVAPNMPTVPPPLLLVPISSPLLPPLLFVLVLVPKRLPWLPPMGLPNPPPPNRPELLFVVSWLDPLVAGLAPPKTGAVFPNEKEGVLLFVIEPPERAELLLLLLFIPNIPPDPLGADDDDEFPNIEVDALGATAPFVPDGCAPKLNTLLEVLLLGVATADDDCCPKRVPGVGVIVEPLVELAAPNTNDVVELLVLPPLGAPNVNGLEELLEVGTAGAVAPNRLAPEV